MIKNILAGNVFPAWRSVTAKPSASVWAQEVNWDDESFLGRLLELLEDELEARWRHPPDEVTAFGVAVLKDLVDHAPFIIVPEHYAQLSFLRFFLAGRLAEHCQMYGQPSLTCDWLLCALSDRPWALVEPGHPLEVDYYPGRLRQFVISAVPVIRGSAQWAVTSFIHSLYYYSWKSGGLRELAEMVLEDAQSLVCSAMKSSDAPIATRGVEAASALATWWLQSERPKVPDVVRGMAELHGRSGAPEEARKIVAMTLATSVGDRAGQPRVEWARRALTEHGALLTQHERLQMLVASCTTPDEMAEKYDEVMAAVEQYTSDCDDCLSGDRVDIAFRRIQLFDAFAPFVVGLVRGGHCSEAVTATAAWFSVPVERRRKSSVLAVLAGLEEGVMYAVDGNTVAIPHDSGAAIRRLVDAVNHAYDTNIVVRDDHAFPSRAKTGRPGERVRCTDELAEATAAYYELDRAAEEITRTQALAIFQPHTVQAPLVPLARSRLGVAWPTITSFEEPEADRAIRRALIWSYGPYLSGHEARAVAEILKKAGVECEVMTDKELTPDEFLRFYTDRSFDLVWVSAHGMFDPREPHRAHIQISSDQSRPMHLTELIRHPVRGPGRRLLFLNVCLGASVLVTEAPPKLGLAAMLASAEQAVVSHIVEVSGFIAPLFGVGAAIPLARGDSFFAAFSHALDAVRLERPAAVERVRHAAPQCAEFLDWLQNGTYVVDPNNIRTWGTGAFYE
ncbi:hypothetical protein CKO31_19765 [Thiohalocapsa halophila]|uniref:CHAT domain-containing protein n=1 Tax=Thiohalocapsa halophila TaxID=69359 RepID=A0ABS1CLZ3_9GAMM|nr:CHAT domain-containing protein [Thiohalocapsa halophila]MBK1632946.1 hypothetical protein [Thiohalocapsa halophila]